ncbi:type II secretion system protein [Massilia horti]|uniref:Prepilin-type N-terminal cleavage/methylation domain-containing protein n=1 Tax=Massilia horti TaxID=2562153 RepID=A0A4Y9T6I3_9BURK|nr:prepilin-type N-terminal cleavage/methylation domain-containing protein [Massilia horti]TFW34411.1 prepilin-type N-terminal cleavage/methylation domain-containing protein [Massilia horti]
MRAKSIMPRGFTLIELLVALAIIATLLSLAAPRYLGNVERAKEATLKENLATLRDVLDKHFADKGTYPQALDELVERRYLRRIPDDPFTESNRTWILIPPPDPKLGGIYDVHSGTTGLARDGSRLAEW